MSRNFRGHKKKLRESCQLWLQTSIATEFYYEQLLQGHVHFMKALWIGIRLLSSSYEIQFMNLSEHNLDLYFKVIPRLIVQLPWKHSLASPAISTTSPLRRNIANGRSSFDFPPKRKIALQPRLQRGKYIVNKQHSSSLDWETRRRKEEQEFSRYLMLTIGLLQSASMSSRWPPSVSPDRGIRNEDEWSVLVSQYILIPPSKWVNFKHGKNL